MKWLRGKDVLFDVDLRASRLIDRETGKTTPLKQKILTEFDQDQGGRGDDGAKVFRGQLDDIVWSVIRVGTSVCANRRSQSEQGE